MDVTITERVQTPGRVVEQANTLTGTGLQTVDEAIADSVTDGLINFALDVSQVTAIFIKSDQALLLETNDGTTPDNTITLAANIPYVWYTGKEDSLVFTVNITALYATNNSGEIANLDIEVVYDATP